MSKIKIAITHGDTNGVGYEIIFKAFADAELLEICTPIVYGNVHCANIHANHLGLEPNYVVIEHAADAKDGQLNFINVGSDERPVNFGHATPEAGQQAYAALDRAVRDAKEGLFDCLVTCPINKAAIQSNEFRFSGHTEYLQNCFESEPLMILLNRLMRVALVTTHVSVADIASHITPESVEEKVRQVHLSLRRDFQVSAPRIAVLALNPHCGDNGLIGKEEGDILTPVIAKLQEEGLPLFGPYSADGFFGSGAYTHFDAVLAMYHDQGLAPFKALSMDDGVNFTSGLPIVRTSPDHGTAYDIAGRGEASPASLLQAIYTAIDVFRHRADYDTSHANPLPKLFHDRREFNRSEQH